MWKPVRFDEHLERAYQADLLDKKVRLTRFVSVLAVAFIAAFAVLDTYAVPSALREAYTVRGLMLIAPAVLYLASYHPRFADIYTGLACAVLAILGLGINAIIFLAAPGELATHIYFVGLAMVIVAMHTLTLVPLAGTAFVTGLVVTSYVGVFLSNPPEAAIGSGGLLLSHLYFILSIAILSTVAQLLREGLTRDNYVLRYSLQRDVELEEEKHRLTAYLAEHDVLTGLPNRLRFERVATEMIDRAESDGSIVALLFIDLDQFKPVNDQHGHAAGDRVLRQVAERIGQAVGGYSVAARFGGDEFVIGMRLAPDDLNQVGLSAAKVLSAIQRAVDVRGHQLHLGASVGAACFPLDGDDLQAVVEVADAQMYRAKQTKGQITLSAGILERLRQPLMSAQPEETQRMTA